MTQPGLSTQYSAEMPFSGMHAMDDSVHFGKTERFFNLAKEEKNFLV